MKVQSEIQQNKFLIQEISGNVVNGLIRGNFHETEKDGNKSIEYDEYSFTATTNGNPEQYINDHFDEIYSKAEKDNIRREIIK